VTEAGVSAEEEVVAAARRRAAALADRDEAALRRLMHPGLQWTTFRGQVLGYEDYVTGSRDKSQGIRGGTYRRSLR
jgi:hypothetical protein